MYLALAIIILITCSLLILIVLIQNPKGGGLSSGFAGSSHIMGIQRTGDFLEKGTWVLIFTIMLLAIFMHVIVPKRGTLDNGNRDLQDIQGEVDKPIPAASGNSMPQPFIPADKKK